MALSTVAGETSIFNQIKTIQGIEVQEGEYLSDSYVPEVDANGLFKPYVLIKYNGAFPTWDHGIVGPDKDTLRNSFSVFIVAPGDRVARTIRDQVREKMLKNFTPTDGSTLRPSGGYSFIDTDLGYHRHVYNIGFNYTANLS